MVLTLIWSVMAASPAIVHGADGDEVLVAADGRHVFVVRPGAVDQVWEVAHLDASTRPLTIRSIVSFARRPEAIASSGSRCWVLLPAVDAARSVRDLVSFTVTQHPLNEVWTIAPPGRLRYLPSVEMDGPRVELAAGEDAPMVVALPSQRHVRGIARTGGSADPDDDAVGAVQVLRTPDLAAWISIDPPAGFDKTVAVTAGRMAAGAAAVPAILWRVEGGSPRLSGWTEEAWSTVPIDGMERRLPIVFTVGERTFLGFDLGDEGVEIGDLRSSDGEGDRRWRRLARIEAGLPSGDLGIVGTSGGPWIVGVAGASVEVVVVDPITGVVGDVQVPAEDTGAGSLVHLPIPFLVLFASILGAILLRPLIDRTPTAFPDFLERAGLFRRAAAFCVDLVPGAMLSVLVFNLDPASFAEEVRSGDPKTYPPAIFALLFTGVLSAVFETVWDRSIGKAVVGLKVVDGEGLRGTRLQRGLRAALKINVLFMPLFLLVAAVDVRGRGLPELMTRTMVCVSRSSPPVPSGDDS